MNYIDNDIKDFDDYIEFTTFNKFNIRILFTKKIMEVFQKKVEKKLQKILL